MARKDWWYVHLPLEQQEAVENILKKEGPKYGFMDNTALVRALVADFIAKYEEKHGLIAARKAVKSPLDTDISQPVE